MNIKKMISLLSVALFVTALSSLQAQDIAVVSKYTLKQDNDQDGIKNRRDKCSSTPPGVIVDGTGCPVDRDKDGVPDYLDKCPSTPGSISMNGCTDRDNDGVPCESICGGDAAKIPSTAETPSSDELQCGKKTRCNQMLSCDEAQFYLNSCGVKSLDGNKDGTACNSIC